MDALTTAVVPANVIRQVFTEALERLEETWDERMEGYEAFRCWEAQTHYQGILQQQALERAKEACFHVRNSHLPAKLREEVWSLHYLPLEHRCMPPMPRMALTKIKAMHDARAYYTLMLYTIETNAVVHMTQEQIQRMQKVDAENKAARKDGVRDGE